MPCIKQMLNAGIRVNKSQALEHFDESELMFQTFEHINPKQGFGVYASLRVANDKIHAKYLASFK